MIDRNVEGKKINGVKPQKLPVSTNLISTFLLSLGSTPFEKKDDKSSHFKFAESQSFEPGLISTIFSKIIEDNELYARVKRDLERPTSCFFSILESSHPIKTNIAGLFFKALNDHYDNYQSTSRYTDLSKLLHNPEIKEIIKEGISTAKEIKSLTKDEMALLYIARNFVGEPCTEYQQGGNLAVHGYAKTSFSQLYNHSMPCIPMFSLLKPLSVIKDKKTGEITISLEETSNSDNKNSNSDSDQEDSMKATFYHEWKLTRDNQNVYSLISQKEKSYITCDSTAFKNILAVAKENFNALKTNSDVFSCKKKDKDDYENDIKNIFSILPCLEDTELRKDFIEWHHSLNEENANKIQSYIDKVCFDDFAEAYRAEKHAFAKAYRAQKRSVFKESLYQVYDIENEKTGKDHSLRNYIFGLPDPLPESLSKKATFLQRIAFTFSLIALPLTLIIKTLKIAELFFKCGEVGFARRNSYGGTVLSHVCGVLSSLIRYTVSMNPIQAIKECASPTARPVKFFSALGAPRLGRVVGGFLGGLLSFAGIIGGAIVTPIVILSNIGMIAGSVISTITSHHLSIVGSNTIAYAAMSSAIAGVGTAAVGRTTKQIYQEISPNPHSLLQKRSIIETESKRKESDYNKKIETQPTPDLISNGSDLNRSEDLTLKPQ